MKLLSSISWMIACASLAAFTPPGPEIEDGYYRDSEELTAKWYPDPGLELHTPGSVQGRWSTVEEAYGFLEELASGQPNLSVETVGESLLGVPIKALFRKAKEEDALTVQIQGRVHGNEPASTEGALELAYQLAVGELSDLDINVILIPVLNPEGAREMRRRTDTDIDPNRDYILQQSACIRAVYRLMRDYDPEVVLDMHEHSALAWPYDLMTIGPNNPNIPGAVRNFTSEAIIGDMEKAFAAKGLRLGPYRLLAFGEEGIDVRESATTFVSEKNALAMAGRISLLTEGRGIGLGNQHFRRRTLSQYTAARAVVEASARRQDEIRALVAASREEIAQGMEKWILRVEPRKETAEHALLNVDTVELETLSTTYWNRTEGTVTASMDIPEAYVIRGDQTALMDRLRLFGLKMEPLPAGGPLEVEALVVEAFTPGTSVLYGGSMKRADGAFVRPEVLRNHDIEVRSTAVARKFPDGSRIVRTDQANALYLLTLEPAVFSGFAALGFWGDELPAGFEFPVYRLRKQPSMQERVGDHHGDHPADHRDGGPFDDGERAGVGGA